MKTAKKLTRDQKTKRTALIMLAPAIYSLLCLLHFRLER